MQLSKFLLRQQRQSSLSIQKCMFASSSS